MPWLEQQIVGNELWRYVLVVGVIVIAGFLYPVLRFFFSRLSHRIEDGTAKRTAVELISRLARGTLPLFAVWVILRMFRLPPAIQPIIDGLFVILVTVLVIRVSTKLVDLLTIVLRTRAARTQTKIDDHLVRFLGRGLKWFLWAIGLLLIFQNLGYNVTSVLAGLGIGGLAIAFAAQDTLSNIFGAVMIFADRPFQVGDLVSIEGYEGWIEGVGLRSTKLRTYDGTVAVLPNKMVTSSSLINLAARPMRRTAFTIGVTYDTNYDRLQQALDILREVLDEHPATGKYRVYFNSFGDSSLDILIHHWCTKLDMDGYLEVLEEINLEIKRRFEQAQIEFAFPSRTVYLAQDNQQP